MARNESVLQDAYRTADAVKTMKRVVDGEISPQQADRENSSWRAAQRFYPPDPATIVRKTPRPANQTIDGNIEETRRSGLIDPIHHLDLNEGLVPMVRAMIEWYNKIYPKNIWDPKHVDSQYADFGNLNYGATGSALGIPENILQRAAGFVQERGGNYNPSFGHWNGKAPHGDDPNDQYISHQGVIYERARRDRRR